MSTEGEPHNPLQLTDDRAKIEVATELPYVTKRNWSDVLEQSLGDDLPGANPREFRLDQPGFLHVDYAGFLTTVCQRINPEGRVVAKNMLTGRLEITEPIAQQDITQMTPEEREQQRNVLAQHLITIAGKVIQFHNLYAYSAEQVENFMAHFEGSAAELLAPYRHDQAFLSEVTQTANQAQATGRRPKDSSA